MRRSRGLSTSTLSVWLVLQSACAVSAEPEQTTPERQPQRSEAIAAARHFEQTLADHHGLSENDRIRLIVDGERSRTLYALTRGGPLAAIMVALQRDAVGFWNLRAARAGDRETQARCALYLRHRDRPTSDGSDLFASVMGCEGDTELVRLLSVITVDD